MQNQGSWDVLACSGPSATLLAATHTLDQPKLMEIIWLVVSTPLKTISQHGNLPQIGVKIQKIFDLPPPSYSVPTVQQLGWKQDSWRIQSCAPGQPASFQMSSFMDEKIVPIGFFDLLNCGVSIIFNMAWHQSYREKHILQKLPFSQSPNLRMVMEPINTLRFWRWWRTPQTLIIWRSGDWSLRFL